MTKSFIQVETKYNERFTKLLRNTTIQIVIGKRPGEIRFVTILN